MRIFENLLHRCTEFLGNPVGEVERRIVFFRFQRVDCLPRDADAFAEFFLRPVPLGAHHFESVFHQWEVRMKGETIANDAHKSGYTIAAEM